MARLILTEGGKRRQFRLNPGKLTIGSGEAAKLKLESDDVADVHAELEYDGTDLILRMRKGVMPATSRGRKVGAEHTFEDGVGVSIGDATLTLELEEAPQKATQKKAGNAKVAARGAGAGAKAGAAAGARRPVVRTQRRTTSKGVPTWLILLIVAGAGAGGFYMLGGFASSTGKRMVSEISVKHNIEAALKDRDFNSARSEFKRLEEAMADGMTISSEWQATFDELRTQTEEVAAAAELAEYNVKGTELLQKQIKNFQKTYMRKNTRPEARVLVRRLRQFKRDFPQHPELDWCTRMEERFAPIALLHEPDTFEDVKFQLRMLTGGVPADYKTAKEIMDAFLATADEAGKDKGLALWDEKVGEREAYFTDRMEQAKYFWDRDQRGKAVEVLVKVVTIVGDQDMADEAAGRIVAMGDDVVSAMKGYKSDRPADFEGLVANSVMRPFLDEHGLID